MIDVIEIDRRRDEFASLNFSPPSLSLSRINTWCLRVCVCAQEKKRRTKGNRPKGKSTTFYRIKEERETEKKGQTKNLKG